MRPNINRFLDVLMGKAGEIGFSGGHMIPEKVFIRYIGAVARPGGVKPVD